MLAIFDEQTDDININTIKVVMDMDKKKNKPTNQPRQSLAVIDMIWICWGA